MARNPGTRKPSSRKRKSARVELDPAQLDAVEAAAAQEPPDDGGDAHVAKALQYIDDVLAGRIPACKYVKQACQRQRDDLARYKDSDLFVFDADLAGRICRFIELLPHTQGPDAYDLENGEPNCVVLQPWQCFILTTVFGWRRKDTGGRRFRKAYVEVPRGNGKSFLLSGVAIYGLTSDGEQGPENYSAATTKEQSQKVFDVAKQMLRRKPSFAAKIGAVVNEHAILCPKNNGIFFALSREAGRTGDGKNPHVAVVDELHAHKTRAIYDVLKTAMAKRTASLLFVITTAGFDTSGICYEVRSFCVKMLAGEARDESQFAVIYTIDDGDDWLDEVSWKKANPNWGVSVQPDSFASDAAQAAQIPSEQNNFKTKHLGIWCNADRPWMDMKAWDLCGDPALERAQFENQPCMTGLDLATRSDISAKASVFWREVSVDVCGRCGNNADRHPVHIPDKPDAPAFTCETAVETSTKSERHYYLFVDSFLPEKRISDARNSQYAGWVREGWIIATPGDATDFGAVKDQIISDRSRFDMREVAFDEWQAVHIAQEMEASGLTTVKVGQRARNMSAPMKEAEALTLSRRLHHDGNPAMRWMVSNVVAHEDEFGNVMPTKTAAENKIDGPVAFFMALGRAMLADSGPSPYEERGLLSL